jgi:hypothetical protein
MIGIVHGSCSFLSILLVDLPNRPNLAAGAVGIIPVVAVTLTYRNANPSKRPRNAPPYLLFHEPVGRLLLNTAPTYCTVDDIIGKIHRRTYNEKMTVAMLKVADSLATNNGGY